jgi:hypothetical protein
MSDIKKVVEEYKAQNGNANLTMKDLLFYIVARIDKLEEVQYNNKAKVARIDGTVSVLCVLVAGIIIKMLCF